jgi:transcriptional regulator with XRE-family HTH domain
VTNEQLSQALRSLLKDKGWSQAAFAGALGISIPTAKRWLKGEGLLLRDWLRALETLGLTLPELLERAGEGSSQFFYSAEQEGALARTPSLLAYFDLLLAGETPAAIARTHGVAKTDTAHFLGRLAKLKLIEWLPKDRVRLLVTGEPRWNPAGPLAAKFRRQTLREFTDRFGDDPASLRIGIYGLSEESLRSLPSLFGEVLETLRRRELGDRRQAGRTRKVTVLLGAAPLTPSMLELPTRNR